MAKIFTEIDEEFICENCGKKVEKLRLFIEKSLPKLFIFKTCGYKSWR